MPRHSYIRQTKLRNVSGRIDYIQNPKRQEYLYAAYETMPKELWDVLAAQNQMDFKRSGTTGRCIEARELVIALPESMQEYDPQKLLKLFTDAFKEKYGVDCISALHHNKRKTNYHIHLIYSERKRLKEVEQKIATRNMFYDETGRHVRTKKEIMDAEGKICPGCVIVPKGTAYEINAFAPKDPIFKHNSFNGEMKGFFTGLINQMVPEEDKLSVFPKGGPFLATQKIGKNNPKEAEIRKSNEIRQEWNAKVTEAITRGVPTEGLKEMKQKLIVEPTVKSIQKHGKDPKRFIRILRNAILTLIEKIRNFRPSIMAEMKRLKKEVDRNKTLYKQEVSRSVRRGKGVGQER